MLDVFPLETVLTIDMIYESATLVIKRTDQVNTKLFNLKLSNRK